MHSYNPPSTDPPEQPPDADAHAAADLVRQKVARIYAEEPDAFEEECEAEQAAPRSKHQEFIYKLSTSDKDLATIQTEWHNYYQRLPDDQKHQVWHEFYASQAALTGQGKPAASPQTLAEHKQQVVTNRASRPGKPRPPARVRLRDARSAGEMQSAIRDKVSAGGQLQPKHYLQSLLFGVGVGCLALVIFLFGFFNEVIIAPFIQPSRVAAATPLIINSNSVAPTSQPEVIIPKINVQIPVDYNETSTNENVIENDLQDGVVHYPTTVLPGQDGNAAFFGHSSNNIFNQGKYKFAFVLLHTLVNGDTFYLTYNDKVYVYKVISKTVVNPSDVGVLGPVAGQTATATLITCDPPGTSINRLIVVGQQISPDPSTNTQVVATAATSGGTPTSLPGNGPTLWSRFIGTLVGKVVTVIVVLGLCWFIWRRIIRLNKTAAA